MPPDPAGRRSPRGQARGVATVPTLRPAVAPAGTVYTAAGQPVQPGTAARVVLVVAAMMTGMVGGGLLFGQAVASWLGV